MICPRCKSTNEEKASQIRVAICFKNFSAWKGISHIGLGVTAHTNAEVLKSRGIETVVFPVRHNVDIVDDIRDYNKQHPGKPLTHVVISAPWLSTLDVTSMIEHFNGTQFAIISHSNVGFLQADPQGVRLFRQDVELARSHKNLRVGGNSRKFVAWADEAYEANSVYLPNLYPVKQRPHKTFQSTWLDTTEPLRIGAFGAVRVQKNIMSAAAAALVLREWTGVDTEFYLSTGREDESGGRVLLNAVRQMTGDIPGFTLIEKPWSPWGNFKELVGKMDLLINASYTESFNMVTADGVALGVPSVVSDAIEWAPEEWKAKSDDVLDIAATGMNLLYANERERLLGCKALHKHNEEGVTAWQEYLVPSEPCEHINWFDRLRETVRGWF
jgi:hypothetical protein